jgi:hypothetical protein
LTAFRVLLPIFDLPTQPSAAAKYPSFLFNFFVYAPILPVLSYFVAKYRAGRIRVRVTSHASRPRWLFNECLPLAVTLVFLVICKTLLGNLTTGAWSRISMNLALPVGIWFWFGAWMLIHKSIDFRERGVLYCRFSVLPWAQITPGFCRIDDEGHLLIRQGWWGTSATVSPEQRAAIAALLEAKMGEKS